MNSGSGFAQTYSISSERSTSTMKSDPQWSVVRTSTSGGTAVSARASCSGVTVSGLRTVALAIGAIGGVKLAAPATAAPFKKFRRVGENFRGLAIFVPPYWCGLSARLYDSFPAGKRRARERISKAGTDSYFDIRACDSQFGSGQEKEEFRY